MTSMTFVEKIFLGSLWNAALIGVVLGAKWLLRYRLSARTQYRSWYFLAVSLLLPFFPLEILRGFLPAGVGLRQAFTISAPSNSTDHTPTSGTAWLLDTTVLRQHPEADQIVLVLLLVWAVGTLLMAALYCLGNRRLYRTATSAFSVPALIQKEFEKTRSELNVNFKITLCQSHFLSSPISFWWGHFFVILPADRLKELSDTDFENILRHELTHIRHGDPLTAYLFCGIQAIFWFHPLVWIAFQQMRREREAYCDWAVLNTLANQEERIRYGQTILNFAAATNMRFCTADGLCKGKKQLKYRLEYIVDFREDTARKRFLGKCCAVLMAVFVLGQIPFLSVCADAGETYYAPPSELVMEDADWSNFFRGKDGCAVLYDQRTDRYTVYNREEVFHRVPPCSTYKPYSALNALELGLITPEENELSWDGTANSIQSWNRDHTLCSAMQESVNWYFQTLDRRAGAAQLERFFRRIGYGNCQLGSNLENLWYGSGVKISAMEQVYLLKELCSNGFGADSKNIATVKEAISLNETGFYGKTGTGQLEDANIAGWFIGFVESPENTRFIAVYLNSPEGADGAAAYKIACRILEKIEIVVG